MRDRVWYEFVDLHPVPLKGVIFFALVKLHNVEFAKSPSAMIAKDSHLFSCNKLESN